MDTRNLPGLKAREIRKTVNGEGVAAQGPIFYRVTVEQFGLDVRAIQQQHGLELMIGNAAIAAAMGPDDDVAKLLQRSVVFLGMNDLMLPIAAALGSEETP